MRRSISFTCRAASMSTNFTSVDFEVYGKVQGVFFRKHTQKNAKNLGLVGWVKNTRAGTVQGQMQGSPDKIVQMKTWLEKTGSPKSKIEKCEFRNERIVPQKEFKSFDVTE